MEPRDRSAVHRARVAVRTDAEGVRVSPVRGGVDRGSDAAAPAAEEGDRGRGGGSHGDGRREAGQRGDEGGVPVEGSAVPDVFADEWKDERGREEEESRDGRGRRGGEGSSVARVSRCGVDRGGWVAAGNRGGA